MSILLVDVRSLRGLDGSKARLYAAADEVVAAVVAVEDVERGGGGKGLKFE